MRLGVTFNLGSSRMSLPINLRNIYSITKKNGLVQVIIIYVCVILLAPLTDLLQLINRSFYKFYSFITRSLQVNLSYFMVPNCLFPQPTKYGHL